MKKRIHTLLLAALVIIGAVVCPVKVQAASSGTHGTGVTWELEGTTLTISGTGAMKDCGSVISLPSWNGEADRIRTVVIEEGITTIGNYAFYGLKNLTGITIPASVWKIGENAFWSCTALTEITVPDTVYSIGKYAFYNCDSLERVALPAEITEIANSAFSGCESLKDIVIPEGVTSIGSSAFSGCSSLTQLAIPGTVTTIGDYAFSGSGLTTVTIPNRVTQIKEYTFYNCKALTSIVVPAGLTTVDHSAFLSCKKLAAVFCLGTRDVYEDLSYGASNSNFIDADWHFEVTDAVLGTNAAKHCAECDLYFLLDGTGANFADISKTSWQIKHANYAYVRGLMAGKGTDANGNIKFDPNSPITREEFVQVLYNAEGKPSVRLVNVFLDVQNTWYTKAVLWAKSKDIANGTPDGNFGVGKNITRQDLALMLYKYARLKGCDMSYNDNDIYQYADGDKVASYARVAMNWAVKNGVLSGKGNNGDPISKFNLDPAGTATRAECAAMLRNFMTAFGL